MYKMIIDLFGTGLEIIVAMLFYSTFWEPKKLKKVYFASGFFVLITTNVIITTFFQTESIMPVISYMVIFLLSLYFTASITSKFLLSLVVMATAVVSEMLVGIILLRVLKISIEQIQGSIAAYMIGVVASKLLLLFMVYLLRMFMGKEKQQTDRQFNLSMMVMPLQSIILYFIIYAIVEKMDDPQLATLGTAVMIVSFISVLIIMFILYNQRKAMTYKQQAELAQERLIMQLEQYRKLYEAQREIKSIRHDMNNNLIAISGMLASGHINNAIERIESIHADIQRTSDIVDTGLPEIDAVLNAKINRAKKYGIQIIYKVLIDNMLDVEQYDLAIIVASALDNAIEGILRAETTDKTILLNIISSSDYISILVENSACAPVDENFSTSKKDSGNHGFGIKQMKSIALKYNGDIQLNFDSRTNKFSFKALLKNTNIC